METFVNKRKSGTRRSTFLADFHAKCNGYPAVIRTSGKWRPTLLYCGNYIDLMATALHNKYVEQLKCAHQSQVLTAFVILEQCNLAVLHA